MSTYVAFITGVWHRSAAHYLSRMRARAVRPWLKGDILDIGCGGEYSLTNMLNPGQVYVGVDIQQKVISELARENPHCKFHCIDIESSEDSLTSVIKEQFDSIMTLAVIEHLRKPQTVLKQCRVLLKPGGKLVITTPTVQGDKLIRAIKKTLGVKHEEADGYSPHLDSFTKESLSALLTSENLFKLQYYKKFEFGLNQLIVASKAAT